MVNCIFCNSELSQRGYFCKSCGNQAMCMNCNSLLEVESNYCLMCGTAIVKTNGGELPKGNGASAVSRLLNTFEFRETRNERSAKATLTDQSVEHLQQTLSLVVSSYPLGVVVKKNVDKRTELSGELFPLDSDEFNEGQPIETTAKQIPSIGNETVESLKRIFYLDEGTLTLEVQDLKAKGLKDFGMRLVCLRLLYSKEVEGQSFIPRDDLNATLKEVMGSLDPHVVSWISISNDLALKTENDRTIVRLRSDGYSKALEVLSEVNNPEIKGSFLLESKTKTKKSASKPEGPENNAKAKRKTSTSQGGPKDWINKWKELNLNVDLHQAAKNISLLDKILVAVWVINKITHGQVNTATTYKIQPIIKDLMFADGHRRSLDRALSDGYKHHLQKTPDGWRITPTGIKHAENLIAFNSANSKGKGSK